MTITIALAGKGSAGKSTLAPHLIHHLRQHHPAIRLLVVDADPHQSLSTLVGVTAPTTLGHLRSRYERTLALGNGLCNQTREAFAERAMGQEALMRLQGFDLLTMGHWELAGSQCTVNRVLERALSGLMDHYDLVLFDNEAGIEHIGRFATIPLDLLLLVATPEPLFLDVVQRILDRSREVERRIAQHWLVLNRVQPDDLDDPLLWNTIRALHPVEMAGLLPESSALRRRSRTSTALLQLDGNDHWVQGLAELGHRVAQFLANRMDTHVSTTLTLQEAVGIADDEL